MKNRKPTNKQIKNMSCEHHSNLSLLSTAVGMIALMVLMLIYMGTFQSGNYSMNKMNMAIGVSTFVGVACWIAGAVLAIISVLKKKKYLIEYIVYSFVMGFLLFFMYNMPPFLHEALFKGTPIYSQRAIWLFRGASAIAIAHFVISVIWHGVLATPKKAKKK